jgi:hypothetical protein
VSMLFDGRCSRTSHIEHQHHDIATSPHRHIPET